MKRYKHMKKFKVSIAGKVPFNYEVEVEAKNEKEALDEAVNSFGSEMSLEMGEPDWYNAEIDIKGRITTRSNGVDIKEL